MKQNVAKKLFDVIDEAPKVYVSISKSHRIDESQIFFNVFLERLV